MPEVSVIMSVYNGMPYLPEAVDSILGQTVQDFTFLIINDGSTDGTEDYLNKLNDQRIHVVHQSNRGQGAGRNVGLAMCNSEFVAMMDADDVALPSRLEAQLCFFNRHSEIGMVGTHIAYLGVGGRIGFSPPMACDHEAIYADLLRVRHALVHSTLMCRTSILKRIGGYRIDGKGEDWDMFLRMGEATRLANLSEVHYLYRLHSGSVSVRHLTHIRNRFAHSCHCAKRRQQSLSEITFDEFVVKQRARPFWQRATELMDIYALDQYRRALAEILSSHRFRGYARLSWAAMCSPRMTSQRIARAIRKGRKR